MDISDRRQWRQADCPRQRAAREKRELAGGSDGIAEDVGAALVGDIEVGAGRVAGDSGRMNTGREGNAAVERCQAAIGIGRETEDVSDIRSYRRVVSGDVDKKRRWA